ncbi:MAG: BMP family ABC transporter substrate-binding protein [Clostridia bacterium]|nr:BMP family ABC transporter substrate-binding protein [Clostridia bacterium]
MKKIAAILLIAVLTLGMLVGCHLKTPGSTSSHSGQDPDGPALSEQTANAEEPLTEPVSPAETTPNPAVPEPASPVLQIAMITDGSSLDYDDMTQLTFAGIKEFASETGSSYWYCICEDAYDTNKVLDAVGDAVSDGANVIVCPGWMFETGVYEAQKAYPNVNFLLVDGEPHDSSYLYYETAENTHCILYRSEEAGFLAGYATVKDGYRNLGILAAIAVNEVIRYNYGFIQGANLAAEELGVADEVTIRLWYCDQFYSDENIVSEMKLWYEDGVEAIFACGGGLYLGASEAADSYGGKVIGCDYDVSEYEPNILTSAVKFYDESVRLSLWDLYRNGGKWPYEFAGRTVYLGLADDCLGLPTISGAWRFRQFSLSDYNDICSRIRRGQVTVSNDTESLPDVSVNVDYIP